MPTEHSETVRAWLADHPTPFDRSVVDADSFRHMTAEDRLAIFGVLCRDSAAMLASGEVEIVRDEITNWWGPRPGAVPAGQIAVMQPPSRRWSTICETFFFKGTSVLVSELFDALDRGEAVAQFLERFPAVGLHQVDAVLASVQGPSEPLSHAQR